MPSIVLDDECLISKDLSKALLGRVKEFASLPNLKIVLKNEGFAEIKIQYMGKFWVLLEFPSSKTKELFQENMGVGSWFFLLKQASSDFILEGKIVCYGDDSDEVEVPKTVFEESLEQKENQSKDPFGIYLLLNKNKDKSKNIKPSDHILKYPPGFTPNGDNNEFCMHEENVRSVNEANSLNCNMEENQNGQKRNSTNKGSKEEISGSVCLGNFKKSEVPRTRRSVGGSSMNCLSLNIQGLTQKAKKDWVKELCIKNKVNFLAIQETKLENMDLWCVKACWGIYAFDFVHSDFVGNSGGILCIWDPNSFRKNNVTVSDYFCMVRGVWLKTGVDILKVVVYAPQELRDKRILWDYLEHVINQWDVKVVIMGDFNKVRFKSERSGSVFNVQGANVFNVFIANAGLEEVPLGGISFTWCHKSATKMSKLDRFLISKNLMISCPNISAISLDRYLSDHCPILLRESQHDYGPTLFLFFNHWLELDCFNKFVTDMWNLAPIDESNAMRNVMIKLKFLKRKIREWLNDNRNKSKSVSDQFKEDLQKLDADIDKGIGSDDIVNKRLEVSNSIQYLDKIKAMDVAQKAKIKWAIEGDENTRFDNPTDNRVHIDMNFPKSITIDQQMDLECAVSKEELKRAVWECGPDKSSGPDGFSSGFYRQFWSSIENDVFAAVSHFFTFGDIHNGCNSCFIALIPKVPDANLAKDFRPISLIESMYKIIAKILANRLVGVLGDIVNEVQSAFITERQILDGPFIFDEVFVSTFVKVRLLGLMWVTRRALMMKWVWRFYSQKESLWVRVIKAIYGDDGQLGKASKAGSRSCWRNIVIEVRILSNQGIKVLDYMRIKLGNGESTAFWDDNWIGGKVLKYSFPRIYALETKKELTVNSKMSDTRWVWSLEGSGEFSVASIRKIIDDNRLSTVDTRTLWIKYVPIKVNVLAWKINIEALPTRFNISRRGQPIRHLPTMTTGWSMFVDA
uniref:RNA-directed DNA polymerase, eukaryota n=1 Tax=Tanacetum cinerariifolium TaxID=118510 RepID=A0A6L2L5B2_TANCI|nr:RNA-directed DNA polymerase, eukaryota [Tanacetum cinerariifolium]